VARDNRPQLGGSHQRNSSLFFISTNETHSGKRKSHDETTAASPKVLLNWSCKIIHSLDFKEINPKETTKKSNSEMGFKYN
jgi:hypothetical protein